MSACDYGKEIIALVVFNQEEFLSQKPHWFRVRCEILGWELSACFCEYLFAVLFVICANPSSVKNHIESIKGTWGATGVAKKVKKSFKEAAAKAEKEDKIQYKGAFSLLKKIFPNHLK